MNIQTSIPPTTTPSLREMVRSSLRWALFILLGGAITSVGSERMFWFWASDPRDHWVTSLVYAVPFAAALWAISRFRVGGLSSLLLVAPLFAYVTEGVITPVMYSGGPFLPVFPAWFTFWHGFIGLVLLWYLLHLWLVRGRWVLISVAAAGVGLFWGIWSTTLWLPENVGDTELLADNGGPLRILGPLAFARYVLAFTLLLALFHWVWGRLRVPSRFDPPRWPRTAYLVAIGGALVMWTLMLPWAAPMFVLYAGLQILVLRRHERTATGPPLLETLSGPVSAVHLIPLMAIPVTAAGSYWLLWQVRPADAVLNALMFGVIAVQSVSAALAVSVVAWRTVKASRGDGQVGGMAGEAPEADIRRIGTPRP